MHRMVYTNVAIVSRLKRLRITVTLRSDLRAVLFFLTLAEVVFVHDHTFGQPAKVFQLHRC